MKVFKIVAVLFCFTPFFLNAQTNETAKIFKKAKAAYNAKNYKSASELLLKTKKLLGGTNTSIQPMLIKSLIKIENWQQAKTEIITYFNLEPNKESDEYFKIVQLDKQVDYKISQEEKAYNLAKRNKTVIQCQSYLNNFPYGKNRKEINELLLNKKDYNAWTKAKEEETVSAYLKYIKEFPDGNHSQAAHEKISNFDEIEFNKAKRINSITSLTNYLKLFPFGDHYYEAKSILKEIHKQNDLKAFTKSKKTNTISSYQLYLDKYPYGDYKNQALEAISQLKKKHKNAKKFKNIIFGNELDMFTFYVEKLEGINTYQFGMIFGTSSPFGFSLGLVGLQDENEFISGGISSMDISAYVSANGGMGIYATVGYRPAITTYIPNDDYFYANTSAPGSTYSYQSYKPEDIDISDSKFHYGIGYQNVFGKLFMGVSYEWFTSHYKADEQERISFKGLDAKINGSSFNFKLGFSF